MLLLGVSQEVAKKETQAFPLGTPLSADAGLPRRDVCTGKRLARIFAFRFCLKFVLNRVRSRWQRFLQSFGACYFRARIFLSKCGRKV